MQSAEEMIIETLGVFEGQASEEYKSTAEFYMATGMARICAELLVGMDKKGPTEVYKWALKQVIELKKLLAANVEK